MPSRVSDRVTGRGTGAGAAGAASRVLSDGGVGAEVAGVDVRSSGPGTDQQQTGDADSRQGEGECGEQRTP